MRTAATSAAASALPPASTNAEVGPAESARAPPAAAPIEVPIAVAVASQANASVTVPAGAASSTMA